MEHAPGHRGGFEDRDAIASSARSCAAESPAGTGTDNCHFFRVGHRGFSENRSSGFRDSGPYRSVTNRFRARMEIGRSNSPRRQAASQGWPQIRPHIEAKGLGSPGVSIGFFVAGPPRSVTRNGRPECGPDRPACRGTWIPAIPDRRVLFVGVNRTISGFRIQTVTFSRLELTVTVSFATVTVWVTGLPPHSTSSSCTDPAGTSLIS